MGLVQLYDAFCIYLSMLHMYVSQKYCHKTRPQAPFFCISTQSTPPPQPPPCLEAQSTAQQPLVASARPSRAPLKTLQRLPLFSRFAIWGFEGETFNYWHLFSTFFYLISLTRALFSFNMSAFIVYLMFDYENLGFNGVILLGVLCSYGCKFLELWFLNLD